MPPFTGIGSVDVGVVTAGVVVAGFVVAGVVVAGAVVVFSASPQPINSNMLTKMTVIETNKNFFTVFLSLLHVIRYGP
jgi:hypothetical protein